jgi:hypothetical protein
MIERPPVRFTVRALQLGELVAVVLFGVAILAHLAGSTGQATFVGTLGVVMVIATPALALVATMVEARQSDRATVLAALLVLGVLTVATGVALYIGR